MEMEVRSYRVWVLVRPSDEVEGLWTVDIPSLDYFSQGRTPTEAIEAAREVSLHLILHELNEGRDPLRQDPQVEKEIAQVLLKGEPVQPDDLDARANEILAVAAYFKVDILRRSVSLPGPMTACETPGAEATHVQ